MKTVHPERRNPRLSQVEGFEGRTTEIAAPLLGILYPTTVTNCNIQSVTIRNTLRLTKPIAAGRKLAQMPKVHGIEPTAPSCQAKGSKQVSGHIGFQTRC
jgi:hypothetical protein